ncbi:hypothetical protein Pcinc_014368 [Petrolisthes cinctipes]|uniref:Major facilitator superfamily (MFS) profile domain-containing protein n=1 Tax=Petrolisthes cinctipes TaxID=88211 RepID=A0AAE1FVG8_PETCI|nr:hypothetical protein Pcinc_014368 [Petrolisthes cinctipes]
MLVGVTEKLSFGGARNGDREGHEGQRVQREKKEIGKTQEANAVKKNGIAEGDHEARTGKEDKLGSEERTGKGREEMTDEDYGKANEDKTEGGDVVTGNKEEFLGRDVGDELRVKRDDTNTGGGNGKKTTEDDMRTEGEEEEEVLMEEVLTAVGVGRWQIPLILTAIIIQAVLPLHELGSALFNAPLPFHCSLLSHNATTSVTTNISEYKSECLSEVVQERGQIQEFPSIKVFGPPSCPVVHYNTSVYVSTVTSQPKKAKWYNYNPLDRVSVAFHHPPRPPTTSALKWNLVCEWQPLQPMFQMVFGIGNVVGVLASGYLSDSLGRRTVIRMGAAVCLPACLVMVISPWYSLILAMRVVLGITDLLTLVPIYTIKTNGLRCLVVPVTVVAVMESCPPRSRTILSICTSMASGISLMCLGGVSLLVREWRLLLLICTVPSMVLVILVTLMDESPRWLVQRGRGHQAAQLLTKAATLNKTTIPPHLLSRLIENGDRELGEMRQELGRTAPQATSLQQEVKECAASPIMRRIFVAASVLAISNGMLWLGIPINANNFDSARPQQYVLMVGIADGLSVLFSVLLIEAVPRRLLVAVTEMIIALLFFFDLFVSPVWKWLSWVLVMVAFCLNAILYELTLVYFVELVPTVVRSKAITLIELTRCFGEIIVPFITDLLGTRLWWSVDVSFMVAAMCGGLAVLFLPETRHQPLPDTIADLEKRHRRNQRETKKGIGGCYCYCCPESEEHTAILLKDVNTNTTNCNTLYQNDVNTTLYQSKANTTTQYQSINTTHTNNLAKSDSNTTP